MSLEQAKMALYERYKRKKQVKDPRALEAFLKVKREDFLPEGAKHLAYVDSPISLFAGQTMSAPHMTVLILDYLKLSSHHKILEIGTGSGYQAALLAEMVPDGQVVTIEIIERLYHFGKENLERAGYTNVKVFHGDGTLGVPEEAPFNRIILTAAGDKIPPPLIEQLIPDEGILCMPLGRTAFWQKMINVRKKADGKIVKENLASVAFVPLRGKHGV
ncbi:MAG: protein-L-isoaspartate(D-aspartate) O-methyltransferase [Candidatus Hodarchaeales archaeon]|jgi:protein-L-isoaspartate(D-aspartate) O-methyltransferase